MYIVTENRRRLIARYCLHTTYDDFVVIDSTRLVDNGTKRSVIMSSYHLSKRDYFLLHSRDQLISRLIISINYQLA